MVYNSGRCGEREDIILRKLGQTSCPCCDPQWNICQPILYVSDITQHCPEKKMKVSAQHPQWSEFTEKAIKDIVVLSPDNEGCLRHWFCAKVSCVQVKHF